MDAELISLIQKKIGDTQLSDGEKDELRNIVAVLPTPGLQILFEALELGPVCVKMFFESYQKKASVLAQKDMRSWRRLIKEEARTLLE